MSVTSLQGEEYGRQTLPESGQNNQRLCTREPA